jgi:hypothetical protein
MTGDAGYTHTQLLSGASDVAHGDRLADNQHLLTVSGAIELADYSHGICM